MALLEEQFTETLDAGAPDITYQGNEGKEQKIARQLWDQLPPEAQQQFGNFQQFFSSGAWKQVLQMLQEQKQQAPQQMSQQPQQGLGSMMPAQMAGGGDVRLASHEGNDAFLEQRYEYYLDLGWSPRKAAEQAQKDLMEGNYQDMAYGGIAGLDGRRAYGWGSKLKKVFKKVTKPIKKIVKSPIGKAAAAYGLGTLLGGMPAFTGKAGFNPSWKSGLNLFKPSQWSQSNWLNPLVREGLTKTVDGKQVFDKFGGASLAKVLGGAATLAPFAMQAAGKWDMGEEDLSKFAEGDWGFDYKGMIRDIQAAQASGLESEVAKVMAKYNLGRGDMPGSKYIGTAAEGGRIGYAEGGWEAREKQNLISKLVNMGLPLPQAMKMAEMIIANATPEELQSAIAGTQQQGLTPQESIKFQETIETPTEDISVTDRVSEYLPNIPQHKPARRNVSQAMMGRMQQPEISEMVREQLRTPELRETIEEIKDYLPKWGGDAEQVPGMNEGGLMSLGGNEMDLRGGGFVPIGAKEKADDVPARLSKNEFVFTADAVRAAGDGNVDKGADKMYKTMKQLENRVG